MPEATAGARGLAAKCDAPFFNKIACGSPSRMGTGDSARYLDLAWSLQVAWWYATPGASRGSRRVFWRALTCRAPGEIFTLGLGLEERVPDLACHHGRALPDSSRRMRLIESSSVLPLWLQGLYVHWDLSRSADKRRRGRPRVHSERDNPETGMKILLFSGMIWMAYRCEKHCAE